MVLACYGTTVGLGTWDSELNTFLSMEGKKYLMLWMMVYIVGLATIKSSICATLYRSKQTQPHVPHLSASCLERLVLNGTLVSLANSCKSEQGL